MAQPTRYGNAPRAKYKKPFNWYGGKGNMIHKLLPLIPKGGLPYVEPYCGSCAVFFAREPAKVEAINDIDHRVINFYRCIQNDETFERLKSLAEQTSYSRAEYARAIEILKSYKPESIAAPMPGEISVERAWAFYVVANMTIGGRLENPTITSWSRLVHGSKHERLKNSYFDYFKERLRIAQIDCVDALKFIRYWDTPTTVMYVDPPYLTETRGSPDAKYLFDTDLEHHRQLVDLLLSCKGAVVLSGYNHDVYRPLEEHGWRRIDIPVYVHARVHKGERSQSDVCIESVWQNPKAQVMLEQQLDTNSSSQLPLDNPSS